MSIEELTAREEELIAGLPPWPAFVCRLRQVRDGFLNWFDRCVLLIPVSVYFLFQTVREVSRKKREEV